MTQSKNYMYVYLLPIAIVQIAIFVCMRGGMKPEKPPEDMENPETFVKVCPNTPPTCIVFPDGFPPNQAFAHRRTYDI